MKLVIAVVQDQDANILLERLLEAGLRATKLASTGGFLREGNTTLLIGVENEQVQEVVEIIRATSHSRKQVVTPVANMGRSFEPFIPRPIEVPVGGATVFVVDVEKFERI